MKKDNKTQTISELLNSKAFCNAMGKDKLNSAIKHSTIFSFWSNIVGAKFSNITKPSVIKGQKLYVSAKNPVVIQELTLYKAKLISKINSYSKPLGVEINDIIFNYKNYSTTQPKTLNDKEDKPIWYKSSELRDIEIDNNTKEEFKKHVEKINFLNKEQKKNLLSKIINNEKAKIMQKEFKNY